NGKPSPSPSFRFRPVQPSRTTTACLLRPPGHHPAVFLSSPPSQRPPSSSIYTSPAAATPGKQSFLNSFPHQPTKATNLGIQPESKEAGSKSIRETSPAATMSAAVTDEAALEARLQALRQRLGKKQQFEEVVADLAAVVRDRYAGASPALRKSMYSTVCRVATVLQTRYTAPGFWRAGLNLFVGTEKLVTNPAEKEHLKSCISRAREHLDEKENEDSMPSSREADDRFLFEGHLTVGQEPPPPAWLVADNLARELSILTESSGNQDGNSNITESGAEDMAPAIMNFLESISGDRDLETALEESLQGIIEHPPRAPPASKEVVANLPVITVTEEVIARLGSETECAVCRENLVVGDKMQELPCKHLFHPPCLKPWLDENNSCPICRHELRTDDHVYESRKEREKEEEEDRRGAANAVRGGEFMYI
ncbi:unnamed protein product, partial [Urochloa humidicola]